MESDSEVEDLVCSLLLLEEVKTKKRRKRKCCVGDIFKNRLTRGNHHSLVKEVRLSDSESFFR